MIWNLPRDIARKNKKSEISHFAYDNAIYCCGKVLPKIKVDLIRTMKTY